MTNIINIWFDQTIPDEDSNEWIPFWRREVDRCINGFHLADKQVYISGWLYFHTVYWTIELDEWFFNPLTNKKTSRKVKGTPRLRDNEWIVAGDLEQAELLQKMYVLVGARGFGKSFMCSSYIGHGFTFFDDIEELITGGNHPDIAKLAEKINLGLSTIVEPFQKQRIKDNWKQEVRAGWKDSNTGFERGSNSRIITRNYDDGNNTMATNGTRPKRQIIDEIGKIPNLIKCILDSQPSWMNDSGFFALPWLAGTGGDMEVGIDAGTIFNNPRIYNVLEFDDTWEGKGKIGRFFPVTQGRNEYKVDIRLSDYLGISHPELDRIIIQVSDEERCMEEFVRPRRAAAMKSTTSNEIIKEKAYYPIVPSECFLTISSNDFPIEAIQEQLDWLNKEDFRPQCVELYVGLNGQIEIKDSDRKPVSVFPVQNDTDKTGVIEMVERPVSNPPYALYVAGIDPYKISESDYSDSLGSVYIFKRLTSNLSEPFQYMPVCWYHGRPKDIKEWQENVRMMLKLYSVNAMCENNDYNFITYMMERNEAPLYLAEGQSFLKEMSPGSKQKSPYGLTATSLLIEHWINTAVIYCKEIVSKTLDDGKVVARLGVSRILDRMLLIEMLKFNKKAGNFDRVRSIGICLAHAKQMDVTLKAPEIDKDWSPSKPIRNIRTPFNMGIRGSSRGSKSPFLSKVR